MPHLARHLPMPDLCHCIGNGDVTKHTFFGPKGTVTPVHHDPYHNCFVQVVGSKYVRLYVREGLARTANHGPRLQRTMTSTMWKAHRDDRRCRRLKTSHRSRVPEPPL